MVNEKLRLDIVSNKVEKTIEQGNKEVRACTQNLLKAGNNIVINRTQSGPEENPSRL